MPVPAGGVRRQHARTTIGRAATPQPAGQLLLQAHAVQVDLALVLVLNYPVDLGHVQHGVEASQGGVELLQDPPGVCAVEHELRRLQHLVHDFIWSLFVLPRPELIVQIHLEQVPTTWKRRHVLDLCIYAIFTCRLVCNCSMALSVGIKLNANCLIAMLLQCFANEAKLTLLALTTPDTQTISYQRYLAAVVRGDHGRDRMSKKGEPVPIFGDVARASQCLRVPASDHVPCSIPASYRSTYCYYCMFYSVLHMSCNAHWCSVHSADGVSRNNLVLYIYVCSVASG